MSSPGDELAFTAKRGERMSDESTPVSGVAAGVPYVALPPTGRQDGPEPAPLVVSWHLNDPPRSAAAMTGAEDDPAFPLQAQRLRSELGRRYGDPGRVGLASIPGMGHAFAAEPGVEPAPQSAEAKLVDAAVTEWFGRYLS
jgi:dienelactone hydrolase